MDPNAVPVEAYYAAAAVSGVIALAVFSGLLSRRLKKRARTKAYERVAEELNGELTRPPTWSAPPGFSCPRGSRRLEWRERKYHREGTELTVTELRYTFADKDVTSVTALLYSKDYFDPAIDEFVGAAFSTGIEWLDNAFVCKSNAPTRLEKAITDPKTAKALERLHTDCDCSPLCIKVEHDEVLISKVGLREDYEGVKAHVECCNRLFDAFLGAEALQPD